MVAQGAALAQQIPALIQRGLDGTEAFVFLVCADLVTLQARPKFLLLGHQFADAGQRVAVV